MNKAASLAKAASAGAKGAPKAYDSQRQGGAPQLLTTPKGYNAAADVVKPSAGDDEDEAAKAARKAAKKAKREREAAQAAGNGHAEDGEEEERPKKKKSKAPRDE